MSEATPDPFRFTTIAHRTHRYLSPISKLKAAQLLTSLSSNLSGQDTVLDAGCGKAALLRDLLGTAPARGTGVDTNPHFLAEARSLFDRDAPGDDRLNLINRPLLEHTPPAGGYSAIICVGSTHAFGSFDDCLRVSRDWLKPNGRLLIADGYWAQQPSPDYLEALGGTADEFSSHLENAQRAISHGYSLLRTATSSPDEWDEYEGRYCAAMMEFLADHPEDPDHAQFASRMQDWHKTYLTWGRATLGFGFYLLQRPPGT